MTIQNQCMLPNILHLQGFTEYYILIYQMGNSVSINPLTIGILNQTSNSSQDYEIKPTLFRKCEKIPIQFPFFLVSGPGNTIQYRNENQIQKIESGLLYKCSMFRFSTIVVQNMGARNDSKIWKLMEQGQNISIQPNDSWRIASLQIKFKYLINDPIPQGYNPNIGEESYSEKSHSKSSKIQSGSAVWKCRVCLENSDLQFNPLVNLCKCEGSVKFIHYKCLHKWVGHKVKQFEEPNCTLYQYLPLVCELCKKQIPTHFWHGEKFFSLIQKEQIESPYAIFQSKNLTNKNEKLTLYRVKLNQGLSITMGRGGQSDIPVKCPAVSRKHCLLYYTHKQLFIKDLKSKYGTFIFSKNAQYDFSLQSGLIFLIRQSKIQISSMPQSFFSLNCCKAIDKMTIKIVDDNDDKCTVETQWEIFDFLQ